MGRRRGRLPQHQSLQHRRRGRRLRPGRQGTGREQAIAAAKAAFPAWARSTPQERYDVLTQDLGTRSSRARTSSAACSRARKARRLPEGIGEVGARRRRSSSSSPARRCASRARCCRRCGPASTSRSRASRSASSASSRRGISRSPFRPGRSRRRSPTATRVVFKPAELVPGIALGARRHPAARRPCRRACSTSSWAGLGGRPGAARQPDVDAITLHRLGRRPGARSPRPARSNADAQVPARDGRQEPAGRARRRRPQGRRRSAPSTAPTSPPASAAPRRRA